MSQLTQRLYVQLWKKLRKSKIRKASNDISSLTVRPKKFRGFLGKTKPQITKKVQNLTFSKL